MANTTFSGSVRSKTGFKVINEASSTGAVTETGFSVNSTGQLIALGTHKFQSFAGTLASTDTGDAYSDEDVLVELGTLNTDAPDDLVTPSKFFIHRALIGITTKAAETLVGGLMLSATSGTATNSAVSSGTEIVGAGVTSFNEQLSATQSVTEIDVNFDNTNGLYHIFVPNVNVAIASKYLYAFTTTAINADITAGRFTVELEYSVY